MSPPPFDLQASEDSPDNSPSISDNPSNAVGQPAGSPESSSSSNIYTEEEEYGYESEYSSSDYGYGDAGGNPYTSFASDQGDATPNGSNQLTTPDTQPDIEAPDQDTSPLENNNNSEKEWETNQVERPPKTDLSGKGSAISNFVRELEAKQDSLIATGESLKGNIMDAVSNQKEAIAEAAEARAASIRTLLDDTYDKIGNSAKEARERVNRLESEKIAELEEATMGKEEQFSEMIAGKKSQVQDAADRMAAEAEREGEKEAQRALKVSAKKIEQARKLAEPERFEHYDRADRITTVAQSLAGDAEIHILSVGNSLATMARENSKKLADKISVEANEVSHTFSKVEAEGLKKIAAEKENARKGISVVAAETRKGIHSAESEALGSLDGFESAPDDILNLAAQAADSLDELGQTACAKVNQQIEEAVFQISDVISEIMTQLRGVSSQEAAASIAASRGEIMGAIAAFEADIKAGVDEIIGQINEAGQDIIKRLDEVVHQIRSAIQGLAESFQNAVNKAVEEASEQMDELLDDALGNIDEMISKTESAMGEMVSKAIAQWEKELAQGLAEIKQKVDEGLAPLDNVISQLAEKINESAEKIENETWLERAWNFFTGLLAGLWEGLLEFIYEIIIAILVVLLIVAIAAAILAWFGALAATILAIAIFMFTYAGAIAIIALILTAIGVVIAGVQLYQSAMHDHLSDYERGKLAGKAIFTLVETFLGDRILRGLGKLFKRAGAAGDLGDIGKGDDIIDPPNKGDDILPDTDDVGNPGKDADEVIDPINDPDRPKEPEKRPDKEDDPEIDGDRDNPDKDGDQPDKEGEQPDKEAEEPGREGEEGEGAEGDKDDPEKKDEDGEDKEDRDKDEEDKEKEDEDKEDEKEDEDKEDKEDEDKEDEDKEDEDKEDEDKEDEDKEDEDKEDEDKEDEGKEEEDKEDEDKKDEDKEDEDKEDEKKKDEDKDEEEKEDDKEKDDPEKDDEGSSNDDKDKDSGTENLASNAKLIEVLASQGLTPAKIALFLDEMVIMGLTAQDIFNYPPMVRGWKKMVNLNADLQIRRTPGALIAMAKKMRGEFVPLPETYLSPQYITNHLAKFGSGASYLVPKAALDYFPHPPVGRPDGQFVVPSYLMDQALLSANGSIAAVEKFLGIKAGSWSGQKMIRIDIPNPRASNPRLSSGNEAGANKQWLPGGKTSGGIDEIVLDPIPGGSYIENPTNLK